MTRLEVTPEPTPDEVAAIRRALEAIGMIEAAPPEPRVARGTDRPTPRDP